MELVAAAIKQYWPQVTVNIYSSTQAILQYETKNMLLLTLQETNILLLTAACTPPNPTEEQGAAYQIARTLSACSGGRLRVGHQDKGSVFWYSTL